MKKLIAVLIVSLATSGCYGCTEQAFAEASDAEPTCEEVRHRYAMLTVTHRRLAARGYLISTRERFVERAQLAEKYPECFFETDLGELR